MGLELGIGGQGQALLIGGERLGRVLRLLQDAPQPGQGLGLVRRGGAGGVGLIGGVGGFLVVLLAKLGLGQGRPGLGRILARGDGLLIAGDRPADIAVGKRLLGRGQSGAAGGGIVLAAVLPLDVAQILRRLIGDRLQGTVGAGREGENKQDEQDRAQSEGQLMQGAEHGCFPVLMFLVGGPDSDRNASRVKVAQANYRTMVDNPLIWRIYGEAMALGRPVVRQAASPLRPGGFRV